MLVPSLFWRLYYFKRWSCSIHAYTQIFQLLFSSPKDYNSQTEARSQELLLSVICGCRRLRTWTICCFPRCVSGKQDWKWRSWDSNWCQAPTWDASGTGNNFPSHPHPYLGIFQGGISLWLWMFKYMKQSNNVCAFVRFAFVFISKKALPNNACQDSQLFCIYMCDLSEILRKTWEGSLFGLWLVNIQLLQHNLLKKKKKQPSSQGHGHLCRRTAAHVCEALCLDSGASTMECCLL